MIDTLIEAIYKHRELGYKGTLINLNKEDYRALREEVDDRMWRDHAVMHQDSKMRLMGCEIKEVATDFSFISKEEPDFIINGSAFYRGCYDISNNLIIDRCVKLTN